MKAIILAAGRGSRMKGLTGDKPKCLTPLAGKTLLQWQMSALKTAGIEDIIVIGGYKKEALESREYIALENPRWSETNMVATLRCAREYLLKEECIVSYADIVYHPENVLSLIKVEKDIVITYDKLWYELWSTRFADPLADAETLRVDRHGVILEIGKKTSSLKDIQGQYMGLLKFTPAGWRQVESVINKLTQERQDKLDMTSLLQLLIEAKIQIYAQPINGKWCEADNENDLKIYERRLETSITGDPKWQHDWRW